VSAVTLKDVAARAGVSPKTVSRVINGERHVRANVRDQVLRVVADLDYRPNAFARSLSSSRSYLLGLFIDDPTTGYAADIQLGAMTRCRERSYHLVVEPLDRTAPDRADVMAGIVRNLCLDGAILAPPLCDDPALLDVLDAARLPYVRISPHGEPERSGLVWMDDEAAAREMTAHLIALGHTDIGFIEGDPGHSVSAERKRGFLAAMERSNLRVDETQILIGDFNIRSGLALGTELLTRQDRPTAVFASNDEMALGVLITAIRLGIAVPADLSIVGFDDAPLARATWPQLTTVRQPKAQMAAAAVDVLVDPHYRGDIQASEFKILLGYEIVFRQSADAAPSVARAE